MTIKTYSFELELLETTRWIAQDADGEWYEYSIKPLLKNNADLWVAGVLGSSSLLCTGPYPEDFTKTLIEIED